jgi:hypothetical protein
MTKRSNTKGKHLKSPRTNTNTSVVPVKAQSGQTAQQEKPLTSKEQELLAVCEADIKQNLQGAFVLGFRLEQIRDNRLYRATHKTFALYCSERWDLSKTHANRVIQAHLCESYLKGIKDVEVYVPTKESQVRQICDLPPEKQVEVAHEVFEAVGDREAGAVDFGEAREKLYPRARAAGKEKTPTEKDSAEIAKPNVKAQVPEFDTNLVSFQELYTLSVNAYNTYSNSARKKEVEKALFKLKAGLKEWADWQSKNDNHKEAV